MNKRSISEAGIIVGKFYEGCRLEAYPDPGSANGHPWTIGYGHTGPEVVPGLEWTQEQADAHFPIDCGAAERDVLKLVTAPLTQGMFDALVLFTLNCGSDIDADSIAEGLGDSTLLRKLNDLDYKGAAEEFPKWCKNDGKIMKGLKRRRAAEVVLFNGGTAQEAIAAGNRIR